MNLLIIDDDVDWLEDMVDLLASFPEKHDVVAIQPVQGTEFCLASYSPDVVCLDLNMGPLDGLQLAYMFSWRQPIPILMISAHVSCYSLANLQAAGIKGYLTKDQVIPKLKPALQSLHSGGTWFPDLMLHANQRLEKSEYKKACQMWHKLTIRQKDICFLLLSGDSPQDICQKLGLSSGTVKDHLKEIRSIFQVHHSYALMKQLHQLSRLGVLSTRSLTSAQIASKRI